MDGKLDEACWANVTKIRIDSSKIIDGVVNGNADCYADVALLWDSVGFYIGVWFSDDIHNAPNSVYIDAANSGYNDDGVYLLFDYSYSDAKRDSTDPFYGDSGVCLVKGFGNSDPYVQYAGEWDDDDGSGKGWSTRQLTVNEQKAIGWHSTFTTSDNKAYQFESQFRWGTYVTGNGSIPPFLKEMGLNIVVSDNDAGSSRQGRMSTSSLANGHSQNAWCKVTLYDDSLYVKPKIGLSKDTLRFGITEGNSSFPVDSITVSNVGAGTLADISNSISYLSGSNWLQVTKSGTGNLQKLTTAITSGTYTAETYTANVSVSSAGASNTPKICTVVLTVQPALPVAIKRGSVKTPYITLTEACAALQTGDTLLIQKDVTGDLTVSNKNFTIVGTGVAGKAKIYGTVSLTSCTTNVWNVAIYGKTGVNGESQSVYYAPCPTGTPQSGGAGMKALDLVSSKVDIRNSYLKGGNGGARGVFSTWDGQGHTCACGAGGIGGNALSLFNSTATTQNTQLSGGANGTQSLPFCLVYGTPVPGFGGFLANHSRLDTSNAIIDTLVWDPTSTIGPPVTPGIAASALLSGPKEIIQQIGFVTGGIKLRYYSPAKGLLKVALFDVAGRCQMQFAGEAFPGEHTLSAGAATLRPGVYLVKATIGGQTQSGRVALMK